MVTGLAGTFRWMAPEFRDDASTKVNQLCDAFSYGMILYEIFAQEVPFADTSDGAAVTKKIREGERPPTPPGLPNSIKILMERCWEHESHGRPTFDRILQVGSLRSQQYSHKAERKAITIIIVLWILHQVLGTTPTIEEGTRNVLVSSDYTHMHTHTYKSLEKQSTYTHICSLYGTDYYSMVSISL